MHKLALAKGFYVDIYDDRDLSQNADLKELLPLVNAYYFVEFADLPARAKY